MMLITRNPEFNRNLWIEFSWHRVLAAPVLLMLFLGLLFSLPDILPKRGEVLELSMLVIAGLSLWLAGVYPVLQNLYTEWERHTWDIQRLSPIKPWALVWGKIFGCTAYLWYIGLLALLVYLVLPGWYEQHSPFGRRVMMAGVFICIAVILQALAFLLVLYSLQISAAAMRYVKRPSVVVLALGLFGIPPVIGLTNRSTDILWYNQYFEPKIFLFTCTFVLALWALYGAYRITRSDFLYRNGPLPWLLFSVFLPGLFAGFYPDNAIYVALIVSLVMLYGALFSAPVDTLRWHHTLVYLRQGQWQRVGETIPLWTNGLPVALSLLAYATVSTPQDGTGKMLDSFFYLSLAGFVVRDICLLHLLHFSQRNERALAACLMYLIVLYALMPALATSMDMRGILGFFLPLPGKSPVLVWLEAAALAFWTRLLWQQYAAKVFSSTTD